MGSTRLSFVAGPGESIEDRHPNSGIRGSQSDHLSKSLFVCEAKSRVVLALCRSDLVELTGAPVLQGADAVIWALGARFATDGPDGAVRIDGAGAQRAIAAAEAAGVRRWVQVSSLMADRPESGPPFLLPFLTAKGDADAALLAGPMTVTVLRPSGLTDEPGQGTVQAAEHLTPDDWGGDRSPMVSRQDVADIYWLRTLQHYGRTKLSTDPAKQFDLLQRYLGARHPGGGMASILFSRM